MAKHCTVCNQSYPDDLAACPRCSDAVEVLEEAPPEGADASQVIVELAGKGQERHPLSSDESMIVVELGGKKASDSDSNVIIGLPPAAGAEGSASNVELGLPPGVPGAADRASESEIDLGAAHGFSASPSGSLPPEAPPASGESLVEWAALVEDAPGSSSAGEVRVDSPSDADILAHASSPVEDASAVNLGGGRRDASGVASDLRLADEALDEGDEGSADAVVDLAGVEESSGVRLDQAGKPEMASDSDLDLGLPPVVPESSGVVVTAGSGELGPPPVEPSSESLRPGAPLGAGSTLEPGETAARRAADEDAIGQAAAGGEGTSAVDLGAGPLVSDISSAEMGRVDLAKAGQVPQIASDVNLGGAAAKQVDLDSARKIPPEPEIDDLEATAQEEADEAAEDASATFAEDEKPAAREEPEPAVEEEEAPVPMPAKRRDEERARGGLGRVLVGGVAGLLVGLGASAGLMFGAPDLLAGLGVQIGKAKEGPRQGPQPQPRQEQPAGPEAALAQLRSGDFERALPALESFDQSPQNLAARGEARWLHYLQKKEPGAPIKADEEQVKQAAADLQKAFEGGNADAAFWLGQIEEHTRGAAAARKVYADAQQRFKDDPAQVRRFQAALDRLDARAAAGGQAALPAPHDDLAAEARVLALVLTGLQGQPQQPAADDEAGFAFWSAMKLAQKGDYAAAVKALDTARQVHDRNRFARLRKAQNPISDPTEEIFLKACDELKVYWQIRDRLRAGKYLEMAQGDPGKALDLLLADASSLKDVAAKAGVKTFAEVAKSIDQLAEARKVAEGKAEALAAELAKAKDGIAEAQKLAKDAAAKAQAADARYKETNDQLKVADDKLKNLGGRLAAAGIKQADVAKGVDELAAARDGAQAALDEAAKKLKDAKYLPPDAGRADLARGVEEAVKAAKTVDPSGKLAEAQAEVRRQQALLAHAHTPAQMLDVWLLILQGPTARDNADAARKDAEGVLAGQPDAPARAKALAVEGLALRSQGDYAAAREAFKKSLDAAAGETAARTLKELTDPAAYYLPRARELYQAGRQAQARQLLDEALQVFPKDNGQFLALRSLVTNSPEDAAAAIKAGALAPGHYAAGRLAERQNNLAEARQHYEQALAAHPEADLEGNRYRIALARVLLKLGRDKSSGDRHAGRTLLTPAGQADPLAVVVLLLDLAAQGDGGAATPEELRANELAEQVLKSKEVPGDFLLRAQAYAAQGLWQQALETYTAGVRTQIRREYGEVLADLVANHPALRRPDSRVVSDPLAAEQHFAAGMAHYFARRFAQAEQQFLAAVQNDSLDARYHYFLGLARWSQATRPKLAEARQDFQRGADLEHRGRPGSEAIDVMLERVQGRPRQEVDQFRK